jgi:hypothetical protein
MWVNFDEKKIILLLENQKNCLMMENILEEIDSAFRKFLTYRF